MTPRGGSELLYQNLQKYVGLDLLSKVNLILSRCDLNLISSSKPNILWQHLSYDQENVQRMHNEEFRSKIDQFVYVSDWQRHCFIEKFNSPIEQSITIRNAIEPIEYIEKPTDKIKLIYTSTPWRGLDILLDVIDLLDRNDFELDVYSSTVIYGTHFMPNAYDKLFTRCKTTKNVNYRGYATNKAVRKALQRAHIFAYPSTFEETSCLSAIEAGAARCQILTTKYGALPETCKNYAQYVNYQNKQQLVNDYAIMLNTAIDNYKQDKLLKEQSDWFNEYYSWTSRAESWKELIRNL